MSNTWYDFNCRCPVGGCSDTERKQWVHAECNYKMQLNADAYLRCSYCEEADVVLNWSFKCKGHGNKYEKASLMSLLYLCAIAGDVADKVGNFAWAEKLRKSVKNLL